MKKINKWNQYSNPWSSEEIRLLKDNYSKMNLTELTKIIKKRSYDAIRMFSNRIGLRKCNKWKNQEIEFIKDNYNKKTYKEMREILKNHSIDSIRNKASRLGLKKDVFAIKRAYTISSIKQIGKKVSEEANLKRVNTFRKNVILGITKPSQLGVKQSSEWKEKSLKGRLKKMQEHPEIRINAMIKRSNTLRNNPIIMKKLLEKRKETLENNPEITKQSRIKALQTKINNPLREAERRRKIKLKMRYIIHPKKDTTIEVKIQNFLKQLGIEFFTHQYIKEIEHGYQCDILIPSMNMVIECDGDYWHKYPTGNEIDHIRTSELIEKGFKVLRLWEFEIRKMDVNEFKERIKL